MSWQGLSGHDAVVERFRTMLRAGRLANTFLFVGPAGIGKRSFALGLAKGLLCQNSDPTELNPCERCPSCVQVAAGTHPDLLQVAKPKDKTEIPLSLFVGDKEHRMQVGFCHDLGVKPFFGGRKVGIINDADQMNEEGANCLLKTLEEPPPKSVIILIGTSLAKQLPTIRSRSQIIRFRPLAEETIAELLVAQGHVSDPAEARRLASFSEGSLERAIELADPALWTFRRDFLAKLAESPLDSVRVSKQVLAFVDEAGKESTERRERIRLVVRYAVDYYRRLLRMMTGATISDDPELNAFVEQGLRTFQGDEETAAAHLDRCLDAINHVDRNANQQTLVECWLDELGPFGATVAKA